jgi:transcriptional regulator with XRE-family HTH domain
VAAGGELGGFLQAQRAKLGPADVGLPDFGRRRVPGLRREEAAQLSGLSVDYYVRLEQGRATNPSPQVLDAIARALRLDAAGREHLWRLAGALPQEPETADLAESVRPALRALLDDLAVPAFVLGVRMDVLAWNEAAAALIADFGALDVRMRSMPRLMFLDPDAQELYGDWEAGARETVEYLRLSLSRHPGDAPLRALVDELAAADARFAGWWERHDVREKTYGTKTFHHALGTITVDYECFYPAGEPDQMLVLYRAEPGSDSARLLDRLTAASGHREDELARRRAGLDAAMGVGHGVEGDRLDGDADAAVQHRGDGPA